MKYLYIIIFIVIFFIAHNSDAQTSDVSVGVTSRDTMPYDASAPEVVRIVSDPADEWCHGQITYQSGDVLYKSTEKEVVNRSVCMEHLPDDTVLSTKFRNKKPGDYIHTGDEISTGSGGRAEIRLGDGSIVRVGPNSHFTLDCTDDFSEKSFSLKEMLGEMWSSVEDALDPEHLHNVETANGVLGVRGTKFMISATESETVIKLAEGKITVTNKKYSGGHGNLDSASQQKFLDETRKNTEDFQNGKITMDELMRRSKELMENAQQNGGGHTINLEPGQMTVIRGDSDPSAPESFSEESKPWYDNSNFGK